MDMASRVKILDKDVCISHSADTFGKGTNPTTLSPAMGKIEEQTGFFFNFGIAAGLGEGKL